jgi:cyclic beta-1,2-glucan synthetase
MCNPINRSATQAAARRYKVEPYAVAADIYGMPPHVGRGGWTWYTASAAWMHRTALEWILGFRLRGDELLLDPCVPKTWPRFEIVFRFRSARYEIKVENPRGVSRGVSRADIDGLDLPQRPIRIALADDGAHHRLSVTLG